MMIGEDMPIYDLRCPDGHEKNDVWAKIDEVIKCECGKVMERLITAPTIIPDWEPYLEENMGNEPVMIQSRQHYREELKKRDLRCIG
jgi:hypothetical protein